LYVQGPTVITINVAAPPPPPSSFGLFVGDGGTGVREAVLVAVGV